MGNSKRAQMNMIQVFLESTYILVMNEKLKLEN